MPLLHALPTSLPCSHNIKIRSPWLRAHPSLADQKREERGQRGTDRGAQGCPVRTCLKLGSQGHGHWCSNQWIRPRALFPGMCRKFGVDSSSKIEMGDVASVDTSVPRSSAKRLKEPITDLGGLEET